ncbi:hypothetical protein [Pseudophaeobacter sp.]|uniref:hypothetical protein n=1 Tax=Pseudophaeobacter sp. TaxID=1971739 RepID=UPI003296E5D4
MLRSALILISTLGLLSGCALDKEADLRLQLSQWVSLGDTYFFESSSSCTAAVFHTESPRISSLIEPARSVDTGLNMLANGQPVVFKVGGKSPNTLVEAIMSRDLPHGISVLSSGLAGVNCMSELVKSIYHQAIMNPTSRMAFIPDGHAMMVVDAQAKALIYVRGNS